MNSMENFFNWMVKTIPKDEVVIWFNIHDMNYEKIELYGDIFKTLNYIITDTHMGNDNNETKITLSEEDNDSHFEWCWKKTVEYFKNENVIIKHGGEHKDYFKSFFMDTFYNQREASVKDSIPTFLVSVFDVDKPFAKSDLDILTELYKMMQKNIE